MNREELIKAISELKDEAIRAGFDFPTQSPETATLKELYDFYYELIDYLENHNPKTN